MQEKWRTAARAHGAVARASRPRSCYRSSSVTPPSIKDLSVFEVTPVLRFLAPECREALRSVLEVVEVDAGAAIVREGDEGDAAFVLLEGEVLAHRGRLNLRRMGPGAIFGELALVGGGRRAATVTAETAARLARLSRAGYERLAQTAPGAARGLLEAMVVALGEGLVRTTESLGRSQRSRGLPAHAEIQLTLDGGERRRVPTGTAPREVLPARAGGSLVVAALVDQHPTSLDTPVSSDASVEPLTTASWEGRAVVRSSAGLALLAAARRVDASCRVQIGPSVGGAWLVFVDGDVAAVLPRLAATFDEIVSEDLPIVEELWSVHEAREHFAVAGWDSAVALLDSWRSATVHVVGVDGLYAISHGACVPRTGLLTGMRLVPHRQGLMLDFGALIADELPEGRARAAIEQELECPRYGGAMPHEHRRWLAGLGIESVGSFNRSCVTGHVRDVLRVAEGFHEKRIGRIADDVAARPDVRVIAIAGPSSSGKTTFIKRLTVQLEINRVHPKYLSLDDYYVDRERTPRDASGGLDFEALEAIDMDLFHDHLRRLLRGDKVKTARYDFKLGKGDRAGGPELRLRDGDVLMIEGIHGLNPAITAGVVDDKAVFRVFVHPATTLPFDRATHLSPADVRLLRRIVRDRHGRNYPAADTIARWDSVRRGEMLHIFPFLVHADEVFDTALVYEPSVLKVYAERYLLEVPTTDPAFPTALRLRRMLDRVVTIDPDHVPPTSLLREFIGGSTFQE